MVALTYKPMTYDPKTRTWVDAHDDAEDERTPAWVSYAVEARRRAARQ